MIKNLFIYLLLFNFLNTVLFTVETPSVAEEKIALVNDEINSMVEFVIQDCMDIPDATPEDEDDDSPDPLKTTKTFDSSAAESFSFIILNPYTRKPSLIPYTKSFKDFIPAQISPPPKLA